MVAIVSTVAYLGLEARSVEVQVSLAPGLPNFIVVGLADKAVAESRERVRGAIAAMGLALPPKRISVNLSPADLPGGARIGSGVGGIDRDRRGAGSAIVAQSLQGPRPAISATPGRRGGCICRARSSTGERAGKCEARAGDRGGGRT